MNKIPNRQAICEVLMDKAKEDKDIMVLCSDSRGSASMTPFADNFPDQFIETGIAEQNLVSISAGLAKCGKKPFACSPACFLSTRSYEQAKVDVAYSNTNVTLIGISGGISYGALGMSHHSAQDIAAMSARSRKRTRPRTPPASRTCRSSSRTSLPSPRRPITPRSRASSTRSRSIPTSITTTSPWTASRS